MTAACLPVGYLIGRPLRVPVALLCGSLGGVAGLLMVYQNSGYRLMGFKENAREVASIQYRLDTAEPRSVRVAV